MLMKKILVLFIMILMTSPVLADEQNQNQNVSALANMTINATQKIANETKNALSALRSKFEKETIEWELMDKTKFSEYYVPVSNKSFFVSIISKHENSKIAIAYSENTRFLYENVYLMIINRNQSGLTLRFVTDQDAKTFETSSEFIMMKVRFSPEVHRLSFYVKQGNKTLFSFENITILHRTYESYVLEESKNKITLEKTSYYGRLFGYLVTGIVLAFGANFLWYRRLKRKKEEEIIGGFLP